MGFFKALGLLIVIPIFGFAVSTWVVSDWNKALDEQGVKMSIRAVCVPEVLAKASELQPLCDEMEPILMMQAAALLSGAVAILLLISFVVVAGIAGRDRNRIARTFPPLVFISLLILAGLVIVQGAILTYGAYVAESYAIERVHFVLIGALGLAALAGGFQLIRSSWQLAARRKQSVLGTALDRNEHKAAFGFVSSLADKLGARAPDNIVVGLEPNFYVTSADVELMGRDTVLDGETLFISLPLSRIFSTGELGAVIGHELGHFRGDDTYFSLKFAPVYAGLSHAVQSLGGDGSKGSGIDITTYPAYALLSYMIEVFHTNVSVISREREFEADKAAVESV